MWAGGGPNFPFGGHFDDDFGPRAPVAPDGAFTRQFRAYPVSFIDRADLERGDKIALPPSALETLTRLNIDYPMLFQLESRDGRRTHCGVQEFIAEEGHANLPYWLMQNLVVSEGSMITIRNVNLPKGNYVKFQPQTSDFLNISNPRAVLEATLRSFTCLTKGDTIAINYNDKTYYIDVLEVAPGTAISIIETDVNTEFEAPADYVEPTPPKPAAGAASASASAGGAGAARAAAAAAGKAPKASIGGSDPSARLQERLEALKKRGAQADDSSDEEDKPPPKPLFPGSGQALKPRSSRASGLTFPPASSKDDDKGADELADESAKEDKKPFVAFGGQGRSLR